MCRVRPSSSLNSKMWWISARFSSVRLRNSCTTPTRYFSASGVHGLSSAPLVYGETSGNVVAASRRSASSASSGIDRLCGTAKRNVRRTRRSSTTKSRSSALTARAGSHRASSRTSRPSGSTATRKSPGNSRTRSRKSSGRPSTARQWWSFASGMRRWSASIRSFRTARTLVGRSWSCRRRSSSRSEHMSGVSARCGTESTLGRWKSSGWRAAARDTLRPRGNPSSRYSFPASARGIRCGGGREARNDLARARNRKAASRSRTASSSGTRRAASGSIGATRGLLSFFRSFLRRLQGSSGRSEAAAAAAAA
ncbi:Os09g0473502, partial [Oryza sativa Japonica Group]